MCIHMHRLYVLLVVFGSSGDLNLMVSSLLLSLGARSVCVTKMSVVVATSRFNMFYNAGEKLVIVFPIKLHSSDHIGTNPIRY